MIVIAVIFHIFRVITNNGKDNPQKLSGYGDQRLHLDHAPVQHLLILLMHDPFGFNRINGHKKQQLSHQRPASFGDPALTLVPAGTNFVQIQTSQFHYLGDRIKFVKIGDFTNQPCSSNRSNAFNGQDTTTIINLLQKFGQLMLKIIDKAILKFDFTIQMFNFQKDTL